jgi:hypothetical protein
MKTLILLLVTLMALSCRESSSETKEERRVADSIRIADSLRALVKVDTVNTNEMPDENAYVEFSVTNGSGTNLRLRDSRGQINLQGLGTPNDTLSRVLTLVSDTHKGSEVIEYKYDDVNLEFFRPKGTDERWLKTVEIKGGPWATARGIKIGDSLADVKSMYPKITDWKDDKNIYQYSYSLEDANLLFGIANDKVTRIKIEYNIP